MLPYPVTLGAFVLIFWCVDITSPALPDLQRSLALSGTSTGLIASAFFSGRLLTNLPAALLVDRVGARRCAMAGGLTLVAGSMLAAIAGDIAPLLVARGIQGIGIALVVTASLLSLLRARPGEGAALTAFNVAAGVGSGFGLATGGFLTGEFGWRAIFWLSAMLGAALLIGAITSRPAHAKAATISKMPLEPDAPVPARTGWWTMALPLFLNLLVYANYSIFLVSLPLYAADRFSAPAGTIGTLLLLTNLVHLGAAIPLGRGIRRFGASRTVGPSLAIAAVGMFAVLVAPASGWLIVPLSIYAVGQIGGNSAAGDMVLRAGGQGGRAVGMLRLSGDVGLVAGPAAVGVLADLAGAAAPFIALSMLTLLAAALSWRHGGDQRAWTRRMPA
ncbi:MAG TPA: MFS transporter [Thermomicrobiales bacterium]|nr:MFS transporter [Thermomicrobiales bacterium]